MEQERERQSLYDYYYIDDERIFSFYAQVYGGLLEKIEREQKHQDTSQLEPKGTIGIASFSGLFKNLSEYAMKEILAPGDVLIEDILSALTHSLKAPEEAQANEFILAEGTISILPKDFLPTIFEQLRSLMSAFDSKDLQMSKHEKKKLEKLMKGVVEILRNMPWDTLVYMRTKEGNLIVGNIKEKFIRENITSLMLKHRGGGIPRCYLVGIKEGVEPSPLPKDLGEVVREYMQSFSHLLKLSESIRVTPIVIFRKVKLS